MHTTAPKMARHVSAAIGLILALSGNAGAQAPLQQLPTVTLYGTSSLRAHCPDAITALQEGLEHTVRVRRQEGLMQVRFTLAGDRVSDIQAYSGPGAYRQQVRQIISQLQCRSQPQQAQQHAFEINFSGSGAS